MHKHIIALFLCVSLGISAFSNTFGYIRGTLSLDDTWDGHIYISLIETFEKEYAVSDNMIIASSTIDSLGNFRIDLNALSSDWSLLRLHIVKKGNPSASLIIGGLDENFYFIIANRNSQIEIKNTIDKPIFENLFISGAPYMKTIDYINKLSNYSSTLNYENSLLEKEFIEEVVAEKLKLIADTCKNPLVSLYALYQIDFHADYKRTPGFYNDYVSKTKNNQSRYFDSFRRQFPVSKKAIWPFVLIFLFVSIFTTIIIFLKQKKRRKIKDLSVQERRIFELLQKGATNQEISDKFNIELSTVKSHVSKIFSKLNLKSRKEAKYLKVK